MKTTFKEVPGGSTISYEVGGEVFVGEKLTCGITEMKPRLCVDKGKEGSMQVYGSVDVPDDAIVEIVE